MTQPLTPTTSRRRSSRFTNILIRVLSRSLRRWRFIHSDILRVFDVREEGLGAAQVLLPSC